jgi:hypothetical protein
MLAQTKARSLGLIETRHVAGGTSLDQPRHHGGAERARAASDNDVTIAKAHG